MIVFWWQGRGYQTVWILMLTMCALGALAAIAMPDIADHAWYWAAGFLFAAIANWKRGTALNSASLAKHRPSTIWQRLFYKPRHRFMSMPMETFSIVLVLAGIALAVWPLLAPVS